MDFSNDVPYCCQTPYPVLVKRENKKNMLPSDSLPHSEKAIGIGPTVKAKTSCHHVTSKYPGKFGAENLRRVKTKLC